MISFVGFPSDLNDWYHKVVWLSRNDVCVKMGMLWLEAVFGSPEKDIHTYLKKNPNLNTKCVQIHINAHTAHTSNKHPEWKCSLNLTLMCCCFNWFVEFKMFSKISDNENWGDDQHWTKWTVEFNNPSLSNTSIEIPYMKHWNMRKCF